MLLADIFVWRFADDSFSWIRLIDHASIRGPNISNLHFSAHEQTNNIFQEIPHNHVFTPPSYIGSLSKESACIIRLAN